MAFYLSNGGLGGAGGANPKTDFPHCTAGPRISKSLKALFPANFNYLGQFALFVTKNLLCSENIFFAKHKKRGAPLAPPRPGGFSPREKTKKPAGAGFFCGAGGGTFNFPLSL